MHPSRLQKSHAEEGNQTAHDTTRAMEGANRWTDNVYAIRKYCETHFGMAGSEFDQAFQVPADFDYMQ